jgi:hypothetical protein
MSWKCEHVTNNTVKTSFSPRNSLLVLTINILLLMVIGFLTVVEMVAMILFEECEDV